MTILDGPDDDTDVDSDSDPDNILCPDCEETTTDCICDYEGDEDDGK